MKDTVFLQPWNFKSSSIYELISPDITSAVERPTLLLKLWLGNIEGTIYNVNMSTAYDGVHASLRACGQLTHILNFINNQLNRWRLT